MAKRPKEQPQNGTLAEFIANMEEAWHQSIDDVTAKAIAEAQAAYQGAELKWALASIEEFRVLHHEPQKEPQRLLSSGTTVLAPYIEQERPRKRAPGLSAKETAPKPTKAIVRDRKAEDAAAMDRLAHRVGVLREERILEQTIDVMQIAQALILCGLPYDSTKKRQITHTARLADGSTVAVTFTAALASSPLPYGSDRTLLYYLLDRAVKEDTPIIHWETAVEFLTQMGMATGGKNRGDLKQRWERLRGLVIAVERKTTGANVATVNPIFRRSVLPSNEAVKAAESGQQQLALGHNFYVEIDAAFFQDLKKYHVPVPTKLLAATRRQSQLQDLCLFLYWRSYAAQSVSLIPWAALREQLWQEDTNPRRIKMRVAMAIRVLRAIWPELQAEAEKVGLRIGPPVNGQHYLPQGAAARRLPVPHPKAESTRP